MYSINISNPTPKTDDNIVYNYDTVPVYVSQFAKSLSNGGYIKIPFINAKGSQDPNLIISKTRTKCITQNLYIFKKNHVIGNLAGYDGLLVIEHVGITNTDAPVYTVFPLKTAESITEENQIDKLIKQSNRNTVFQIFDNSIHLNLNPLLVANTTCLANTSNTVFIFQKPILVSTRFDVFSDTDPFDLLLFPEYKESDYSDIYVHQKKVAEGFVVNGAKLEGDGQLECYPVSMSEDTVETVVIDGIDVGQAKLMGVTINFFVFIVILGIVYITTPVLYRMFVVNPVSLSIKDTTSQPKYLTVINVLIVLLWGLFAMSTCVDGMNTENNTRTTFGLILFIYLLMSTIIITNKQVEDPLTYSLVSKSYFMNVGEWFEFFSYFIGNIYEFVVNYNNISGILLIFVCLLVVLIIITYGVLYDDEDSKNFLWYVGPPFSAVISVYFAYLLKTIGT